MRKQRKTGMLVFLVLLAAGLASIAGTAVAQNLAARRHFTALFHAIQRKQNERVMLELLADCAQRPPDMHVLFSHTLLGWRITGITGQPFPLEPVGLNSPFNHVTAELYYRMPDQFVRPAGKLRRLSHPRFGACAVLPVQIEFDFAGRRKPPWRLTSMRFLTDDGRAVAMPSRSGNR